MILGIYGAGGLSKEIYEIVKEENDIKCRWEDVVFIDDTMEIGEHLGKKRYPFTEICKQYNSHNLEIIIAIGEPEGKKIVSDKIAKEGFSLTNIVHRSAHIATTATIGKGVIVRYNAVISSDAKVGNNVCIQSNVIIGHDVYISDNVEISAGTVIAGHCRVGENVFFGIGSFIKQETLIGKDAVISIGAVVMKDVPDEVIVMGNPARIIKENVHKQVLKRRFS